MSSHTFKTVLFAGTFMLSSAMLLQAPSANAADPAPAGAMPRQEQHAVDGADPARVEAQITELHDKLLVTSAQETRWADVATAMRDTAKEVRHKLTDRADKVKTANLTAVDELHAYEDLQQVQYDGVKRLISPFEALYAVMTPAQMKNADEVFARPQEDAQVSGAADRKRAPKAP